MRWLVSRLSGEVRAPAPLPYLGNGGQHIVNTSSTQQFVSRRVSNEVYRCRSRDAATLLSMVAVVMLVLVLVLAFVFVVLVLVSVPVLVLFLVLLGFCSCRCCWYRPFALFALLVLFFSCWLSIAIDVICNIQMFLVV